MGQKGGQEFRPTSLHYPQLRAPKGLRVASWKSTMLVCTTGFTPTAWTPRYSPPLLHNHQCLPSTHSMVPSPMTPCPSSSTSKFPASTAPAMLLGDPVLCTGWALISLPGKCFLPSNFYSTVPPTVPRGVSGIHSPRSVGRFVWGTPFTKRSLAPAG